MHREMIMEHIITEGRTAMDEDKVLTALPIILQHAQGSGCVMNTLLMVSKSCREAVHRSGVIGSVELNVSHQTAGSFAAWLAQHAGFLDNLTLDCSQSEPDCWGAEETFGQLFGQALQLYNLSQASSAAAGTSMQPSTAVHAQAQPMPVAAPLRLSSLSLLFVSFSSILQAIQPAADSLTYLSLHGRLPHFSGTTLAALSSLKGLRQLELITSTDGPEQLPLQLYDATNKMPHLTYLFIDGAQVSEGALLQLPCSLQILDLYGPKTTQVPGSLSGTSNLKVSLQHLVDLKELAWCWPTQDTAVQLALPQQLTYVVLAGSVNAELPPGVMNASIVNPETCMPVVEQLPALRDLQDLLLGCAHSVWAGGSLVAQDAQRIAPVLGSMCSTQLTFLHINCLSWPSYWNHVGLGTSLQQLPALRHLHLQHAEPSEGDAELLTGLTNLTHLGLPGAGNGVTSAVVLKLACALTGLVFLDVSGCGLQDPVVLPVLGTLTRLEQLYLHHNTLVMNDARMLLLGGLKELTALSIPCRHKVSDDAIGTLFDAVPGLDKVDGGQDEMEYEEDEESD